MTATATKINISDYTAKSAQRLTNIEEAILLVLQSSSGELSPRELVAGVRARLLRCTDIDVKRAVWRLIEQGNIRLSSDQLLSAIPEAA
jgi:hypothetical protein